MRIIGGKFRAKKLNTPSSDHIRPTTDRMRETLFNMLEHGTGLGIRGSRVLDLFAGTGALGIEALSRGAKKVTFVDNDQDSLKLIEKNLSALKNPNNTRILNKSALTIHQNEGPFDVIFIDPPYRKNLIIPTLTNIIDQTLLNNRGIIMIEYASDETLDIPTHYQEVKNRKMGDACFSLLIAST
jgi:16S rRNA (guanine966-N2)-methyltransferase